MYARLKSAGWVADLALVSITVAWGSSFVVIRDALRAVDPFALVAYRFLLAAD